MDGLLKYWPLITFLLALTVVAAETRLTVQNLAEDAEKHEVEIEKPIEEIQQMQIWRATMDERTVNIIQQQHEVKQQLQLILDEVRK